MKINFEPLVRNKKPAGAELGQAQAKLDDVVVVEVVVKAMVEVEFQLLFRVGGGWVELGNILSHIKLNFIFIQIFIYFLLKLYQMLWPRLNITGHISSF